MIRSIHNGGISAMLLMVLLVVPLHFFQFFHAFGNHNNETIAFLFFNQQFLIPSLAYQIALVVVLIIQAMWFSRILNKHQFFEGFTVWPFVVYLMFAIANHYQLLSPTLIMFNFVIIYLYQRIFNINEEEMSDLQIYMDLGSVFAFGVLIFPSSFYLLPLIMIAINQFAVFDLNRLLLFIMSFFLVMFVVVATSYLFISKLWIGQFLNGFTLSGIDFKDLGAPEVLYSFIALLGALVIVTPTMLSSLASMQNRNRKMVNVMLLHLIFGVLLVLLSNVHKEASLLILTFPLSFLFTFGSGHFKNRLWTNILMFLLIFALIFIQWVYIINQQQVL